MESIRRLRTADISKKTTFHYFGYGSNMSRGALEAKGVRPLNAQPAVLRDYQLTFDVPDFYSIEGGMGDLAADPGGSTHGVLYECPIEDLKNLDRVEAVGVAYDRVERQLVTYDGWIERAYVYTGRSGRKAPGLLPSRRYLDILIRGAKESGLAVEYIDWLQGLPTLARSNRPPFEPPVGGYDFSNENLDECRTLTRLMGHVFDLSVARPEQRDASNYMAGRDMTQFFRQRVASTRGEQASESFDSSELSDEERAYINDYLHEFAHEYQWVGTTRSVSAESHLGSRSFSTGAPLSGSPVLGTPTPNHSPQT